MQADDCCIAARAVGSGAAGDGGGREDVLPGDRSVEGVQVLTEVLGQVRELDLEVDPDHLEQILINYLTNATSHGAPPIWVDVRHEPAAGAAESAAVLRVCDRGRGVPSALEPELFDSFRRGTTSGGGSGLGLSIVRQLAELNGGQTWYEPLTPGGSAFAVRLPTA